MSVSHKSAHNQILVFEHYNMEIVVGGIVEYQCFMFQGERNYLSNFVAWSKFCDSMPLGYVILSIV